jgi:hypothetical protein
MTRKVFLTQQQHHDVSDAKRFGDIVTVYRPNTQVYGDTPHFVDIARNMMKDIDEDDNLLLLGDPVLQTILIGIMVEKLGMANILKYDRKNQSYQHYQIDLEAQPLHV